MDPRNLAKEVHVYGYNFEWQTHIVLIVLSLLGIAAIGVILYRVDGYCCVGHAAGYCVDDIRPYV